MTTRSETSAAAVAASAAFQSEMCLRFAQRVPWAVAVTVACGVVATVFELLRFPERRNWALASETAFLVVPVVTLALVRAFPERSIGIVVVATNVLGLTLNAYHAVVGAQVATSIWTLSALVGGSAMLLTWGWRAQALASIGVVVGYPLMLHGDHNAVLTWTAGGVYLAWVVGLSVFAAGFIDRYLAKDFELALALSERESRLESYFNLSLVGAAILARDRTFLEVNDELCRMLGYARGELLQADWIGLVPSGDRELDQGSFDGVLAGELTAAVRESALLRRDGKLVHAILSVRGLPGPLGPADRLIVVVQDITERWQAEWDREEALARERSARRTAEAASRAKDEFLAMVSHELRTPLTPILGWTPMLRAGGLSDDQQTRALESIERSGRSLAQLIDDLLDFSTIVAGKLRLALRPVEMGSIVETVVESLSPEAEAKGVRLELRVTDRHECVSGDPDRLQQVMWNLVSNAIKFTQPGGSVAVEVVRTQDHIETHVRDTGKGLEPELLPHVFDRFWQADVTTTRRYGGLGLGLAIVRRLVELHGGTVAAESAGPGQGASFTVRLPIVTAAVQVAPERVSQRKMPRLLDGFRVLVVDDEADAQEVARVALELCGAEVRTAGSATQALEMLDGWAPTVLLSDIAMPHEDGYALICRVRAREAVCGGHVAALAFTALARPEDRSRLLEAGFDGCVSKPVGPMQLVDAVADAANRAGSVLA